MLRVQLSVNGTVNVAKVLEAPTDSIGEAIRAVVMRWRFTPHALSSDGRPFIISGKLTFYCVVQGGEGKILYPAEAPYLGRWPTGSKKDRTVLGVKNQKERR